MIEPVPGEVVISGSLAGAIVASQVVQLGFEASLLRKTTHLETRLEYGVDGDDDDDDDEQESPDGKDS